MVRFSLSLALALTLTLAVQAAPVKSAKSGNWSEAGPWDTGKVPAAGDKVLIRSGHAVTYDAKSDAVIRGITISGTLAFATDKDTVLNVGLIKIEAGDTYSEEGFDCDHASSSERPGLSRP